MSGTFVVTETALAAIQEVGAICLIELDATFELTGSLVGLFNAQFTIVHFGACDEPAPELFFATGTYEGVVNDVFGSFDFVFLGRISEAGEASGQLIVTDGFGEFEDVRGRIQLVGIAGVGGDYAGILRDD